MITNTNYITARLFRVSNARSVCAVYVDANDRVVEVAPYLARHAARVNRSWTRLRVRLLGLGYTVEELTSNAASDSNPPNPSSIAP